MTITLAALAGAIAANPVLLLIIALCLGATVVNGATDAPNAIATVVGTRAMKPTTAVIMAVKNKMNAAIEIALGSSLQIILFVIPVLTLLSLLFTPMSIVFTPFELVAVTGSVLIANRVASDGESNWLEGLQLVTVYVMIGAAFFFV